MSNPEKGRENKVSWDVISAEEYEQQRPMRVRAADVQDMGVYSLAIRLKHRNTPAVRRPVRALDVMKSNGLVTLRLNYIDAEQLNPVSVDTLRAEIDDDGILHHVSLEALKVSQRKKVPPQESYLIDYFDSQLRDLTS